MVSNRINKKELAEKIFSKVHKCIIEKSILYLEFPNEEILDIPLDRVEVYEITLNDFPRLNEIAKVALKKHLQLLSDKEIEKLWFQII